MRMTRPIVYRQPPVAGGGGGGGGSGTDFIDRFETSARTIGGHPLWDVYTGEGAGGSTSYSATAARFGSKGLLYTMTSGFPYMHFYANDGSNWSFAHEMLSDGSWTQSAFNRLSFWVKHPSNMAEAPDNDKQVEFGTYVRKKLGDTTTQNDGGTHYYHYLNLRPGVWTKVIIDNHPQHFVGGPTSDPGVVTSPTTDGSGWNYFDALTRFYWNPYATAPSGYPADMYFDDFQFYNETLSEDVANIATVEASYKSSDTTLRVGFCRNSADDAASYTAKWSLSDITDNTQFGAATTLGTSGADGLGDYVNKHISGTADLSGQSVVYVAVQKSGRSDFRRIALELT
jgi:hypothetical protein